MAFVQGRLCHQCNTFVLNNLQVPHVCIQKVDSTQRSLPIHILPSNKTSIDTNEYLKPSCSQTIPEFDKSKPISSDSVSQEDMAKLISYMETSRPLWNHKMSLGERSEAVKRNLWNQIFANFEGKYSIEGIMRSWKYVKERYTREKKPEASGSGVGNKKEWVHSKSLKFLDEVIIVNKRTTTNLTTESDKNTLDSEIQPIQKRNKRNSSIETHIGSLIEELKQNRPVPPPAMFNETEPINEDQKFSSYLADIMKDLPRSKKIKLQGKIIAMVIEELD